MLEYLKVKNYKGVISDVELCELGHINVLCGKNNSGKTSILEAIGIKWENSGNFAIGRKFHKEELTKQFDQQAEKIGTNVGENKRWFAQYCDENINKKSILILTL